MDNDNEIQFLKNLLFETYSKQATMTIYVSMFLKERNLEGEFEEFMAEKAVDLNK